MLCCQVVLAIKAFLPISRRRNLEHARRKVPMALDDENKKRLRILRIAATFVNLPSDRLVNLSFKAIRSKVSLIWPNLAKFEDLR